MQRSVNALHSNTAWRRWCSNTSQALLLYRWLLNAACLLTIIGIGGPSLASSIPILECQISRVHVIYHNFHVAYACNRLGLLEWRRSIWTCFNFNRTPCCLLNATTCSLSLSLFSFMFHYGFHPPAFGALLIHALREDADPSDS
jgi:hypothetical protein